MFSFFANIPKICCVLISFFQANCESKEPLKFIVNSGFKSYQKVSKLNVYIIFSHYVNIFVMYCVRTTANMTPLFVLLRQF